MAETIQFLERCPKCGAYALPVALDYGDYFPDRPAFGVCCFNQQCGHEVGWFETPDEAESKWNRIAQESRDQKEETYKELCPFCGREHEQRKHLNIICGCGAKYYLHDNIWLDRKTGEKKPGAKSQHEFCVRQHV